MKRTLINVGAALAVACIVKTAQARDLGVLVLPIHQGKLTSSLLYEHLKLTDDFETRGRADFTSNVTGAQFSYGITDQVAVSVKGGVLIDPQEDAQGAQWQSRAGYLYGIDLYNEVFPATPGWIPGIQLSGGVTGFQVPFDRLIVGNTVTLIDEKESGQELHAAVVGTFKVGPAQPYAGVRGFASTVNWRNNQQQSVATDPDHIVGHAHGNVSLIAGVPVQISQDVRFVVEGRFVNETAVTVGFTLASF